MTYRPRGRSWFVFGRCLRLWRLHLYIHVASAPEVTIEPEGKPAPHVINIMDALKKSMQKQGQAKVSEAVRKRRGKTPKNASAPRLASQPRASTRRIAH